MAFRFLHVADVHLDTPFAGRPDLQDTLRRMLREAFTAAVSTALSERVDAVLICGDLFDGENLSFATRLLLEEQLNRLLQSGIQVLYAVGNHDAGMLRDAGLPEGVIVFDEPTPRMVEVADVRGQPVGLVVGAGYAQSVLREDVASRFPPRDSRMPTVGMLHTQLVEMGGAGTDYAPTSLRTLAGLGYDYWALGHIHKPATLEEGRVVYAGCLCGRDYGEAGPRGATLVSIDPGGAVKTRFVPLAPVEWLDVVVDGLEDEVSFDGLRARVMDAVAGAMAGGPSAQRMVRVRLTGPCGLYSQLTGPDGPENLAALSQELITRLRALDIVVKPALITPPVRPEQWRGQPHMLSQMLDLIDAARDSEDALTAILNELPPNVDLYGARGMDEAGRRAYARGLLQSLPQLVCARMVKEDR